MRGFAEAQMHKTSICSNNHVRNGESTILVYSTRMFESMAASSCHLIFITRLLLFNNYICKLYYIITWQIYLPFESCIANHLIWQKRWVVGGGLSIYIMFKYIKGLYTPRTQMTLILIGQGLVLDAWPSNIEVSWVLGIYIYHVYLYVHHICTSSPTPPTWPKLKLNRLQQVLLLRRG